MKTALQVLSTICLFAFRILIIQLVWNLFMPHYGYTEIGLKQAWVFGIVFSIISGSSIQLSYIKSEAKEFGIEATIPAIGASWVDIVMIILLNLLLF